MREASKTHNESSDSVGIKENSTKKSSKDSEKQIADEPEEHVWLTTIHRRIRVTDMDDAHLGNALLMLQRWISNSVHLKKKSRHPIHAGDSMDRLHRYLRWCEIFRAEIHRRGM